MLSLIHSCPSRNTFHNMVWYYCMCYAMVFSLVFSVQFQTYIRNTLHPVLCWATGCMWSLLVCTTLLSQLLLVVSPVVSLFLSALPVPVVGHISSLGILLLLVSYTSPGILATIVHLILAHSLQQTQAQLISSQPVNTSSSPCSTLTFVYVFLC